MSGDGRGIDQQAGILEGVGAHQEVRRSDKEGPPQLGTYRDIPGVDPADPTYYGQALLKQPVWIWTIPAYLYSGGVSGAAATLGAMAHLIEGKRLGSLVSRCRLLAAGGAIVSTALLIADLGRPARFLYMLRVFRPTSPMSVGSWLLTAFGGTAAGSAILPGALGNFAGSVAGVLGMPLASYTSVLLSHTAIPLWQEARRTMPFLFIGSGISSASALLGFGYSEPRAMRAVQVFSLIGGVIELAGATAVEREVGRIPQVGRPLRQGATGTLWTAAKVLSVTSLALALTPKQSKPLRVASGIAGTLAALAFRFAIFHAGKRSAADPRATFNLQRTDS